MKKSRLFIIILTIIMLSLIASSCGTATASMEPSGQSGQLHYNTGFEALRNLDWEMAKSEFTLGLEQIPDRGEALTGRGRAELELGQYDEAIADFSAALAINPQDATALANRGKAYLELGNDDLALADLSQSIQIAPLRSDVLISITPKPPREVSRYSATSVRLPKPFSHTVRSVCPEAVVPSGVASAMTISTT